MKQILFICFLALTGLQNINAQSNKPAYDSVLAKKLHADDYGMKNYVLVLIKDGTYKAKNKKESDSLFTGHMKNINELATNGKLIVAGPFGKNDQYNGLFIFNVASIDEAKKLCEKDPAVSSKLFAVDFYPWYSSAALIEVNTIHKTIQKRSY